MSAIVTTSRHRFLSARKVWLNLHLYLGLSAGLVLSSIGLTGSLLVFSEPMIRMEYGEHIFPGPGQPVSKPAIDEWIANAHRAFADLNAVETVNGPGYGIGRGTMLMSEAAGGTHLIVTVNPDTGLPLGKFIWEDSYTTLIIKFHASLATTMSWGRDTVAWLGVAMVISMATGLYLWWPRNRNWYVALTLKRGARGRRRLLDLHNLFAVYLYVPLFILASTGIYFIKPHWIDPAIALVSVPRTPDADALTRTAKPGSCQARTTPSQAVDLAQSRFPTATFVLIVIPKQPQQPYQVNLAPPNNLDDKGQTQVFVDRECPVILTAIDGEVRVASETFKAVVFPLHRNMMLGRFGSAIVFLCGLLLPLSFVTGLLLWLDKRRNTRRRSA
jgi:uncharacterized iron-regulated membrane protein